MVITSKFGILYRQVQSANTYSYILKKTDQSQPQPAFQSQPSQIPPSQIRLS